MKDSFLRNHTATQYRSIRKLLRGNPEVDLRKENDSGMIMALSLFVGALIIAIGLVMR